MTDRYLEIMYRKGKPLAAYFCLHRRHRTQRVRSRPLGDGLVADYDESGRPVGLEMTSPGTTALSRIKEAPSVLEESVDNDEVAPLKAA